MTSAAPAASIPSAPAGEAAPAAVGGALTGPAAPGTLNGPNGHGPDRAAALDTGADGVPDPVSGPIGSGAPARWVAEVGADRGYFDKVVAQGGADAGSIRFPAYCPRRRFRLTGREIRVGRRSVSRGIEPEIDLTGPPTDPGVSRMHAVLIQEPGGSLSVIDPGSENGTLVNGSEIAVGVKVPLAEGDTIHLGAWTAITIRAAHI